MEGYEGWREDTGALIEDTLLRDFSKLARVNLLTGEYAFWNEGKEPEEEPGFSSIYDYMRAQAESGEISAEYAEDYLRYADAAFVREKAFAGKRRLTCSYKSRRKEGLRWMTFTIVIPKGCGPDEPWAVFCWRWAEAGIGLMADALSMLSGVYYKILKVNISADTFEIVRIGKWEQKQFLCRYDTISGWLRGFAQAGGVYEDDKEEYLKFTDLERLRAQFKKSRERINYCYRRKKENGYRWVQMELMPDDEYTDEHQTLLLCVRDVHEEYLREQQRHRELLDSYQRDALTLLYNRHKYQEDLEELKKENTTLLVCLYVDVNGLHELNNHLGHKKGDDMLCSVADSLRRHFPEERVYRIGGDEFVMLSRTLSKEGVERVLAEVRGELQKDDYEVAAGIAGGGEENVCQIVGAAELAMRRDKELYYRKRRDRRRKRGMNEELEKTLVQKRDAEYFLKAIATKFVGVYVVDLSCDTMRYIHIPDYFLKMVEKTEFCYSAALRMYMEKYVKPEYHDRFEKVLDYRYLLKMLEEDGGVQLPYQKAGGMWMELRILPLDEQSEEKCGTIWIFTDEMQREW